MEVAVIILLVVVVVAVVVLKKKSGGQRKRRPGSKSSAQSRKGAVEKKRSPNNTFLAVSINCGENACDPALTLTGQRFLVNEAPTFPLLGCNAINCNCKYAHHATRREHDEDRRAPSSLKTNLFEDSGYAEQRQGLRRRSTDPR